MESEWNAGVSARGLNSSIAYALIGDGIIDPAEHTISLEKKEMRRLPILPWHIPITLLPVWLPILMT